MTAILAVDSVGHASGQSLAHERAAYYARRARHDSKERAVIVRTDFRLYHYPPVSGCEQDFENEKREGRFVQAFPSIYFVNANHPAGGTVYDFKR